jgi:hypothetical protein
MLTSMQIKAHRNRYLGVSIAIVLLETFLPIWAGPSVFAWLAPY